MTSIQSKVSTYNKSFPTTFTKAKGSILIDHNNREYLDFFTGAGTINYGHNNTQVKRVLIDYLENDGILHSLDMDTQAKEAFLNKLYKNILKPRCLDYKVQFCSPSGSSSVESAFKLARKVKKRKNIIAFSGSFHGMTMGSLSATANQYYKNDYMPDGNITFLPYENFCVGVDSLALLRKVLYSQLSGVDLPAAIILETIQADGGINIASNLFLKEIRSICTQYDILMIIDDIQVGNGRSGDFFSFERAGIVPDIVTVSKAIGGGLPLSLLLFREKFDIWKVGEDTGTFRGNNLAFLAGSVVLDYWKDEELSKDIKFKERLINDFFMNCDDIKSFRGLGLIWGVELDSNIAEMVRKKCFNQGLIVELVGENGTVIKLLPPLTISKIDLLKGLSILKSVIIESLK